MTDSKKQTDTDFDDFLQLTRLIYGRDIIVTPIPHSYIQASPIPPIPIEETESNDDDESRST